MRKGTIEYLDNLREIKNIDRQLESGSFAMVSLIIDNRLFVANVGTSHCFICVFDKNTNEKKVISLALIEHNITNFEEMIRISKLMPSEALPPNTPMNHDLKPNQIHYTRCLGDFKLKLYYHEYPQFRDCTGPPIINHPNHLDQEIIIDDSFLFMAMYSDGLSKVLKMTDVKIEDHCSTIAKMLIGKIISEQTLKSAAQSVLDEIKRAYDDKLTNVESEREDLTLIVRVFDTNIKNRLIAIENHINQQINNNTNHTSGEDVRFIEQPSTDLDDINTLDDTYDSSQYTNESSSLTIPNSLMTSLDEKEQAKRSNKAIESHLDKDGNVIPYINLQELDALLSDEQSKKNIDEFCAKLMALNTAEANSTNI